MILDDLAAPIVLAPLAGGPSTPGLTAAVTDAGGFAFLGAGYLSAEGLREQLSQTRALTRRPFGVNVFVPGVPDNGSHIASYAAALAAEAHHAGTELGSPRFDDDGWDEKIELLTDERVPAVSFTFGCPTKEIVARLQQAGSEVWVTVTNGNEAATAVTAGADVLVVQGAEAGGHRASFRDDPADDLHGDGLALLPLLQLIRAGTGTALVATGGIATGAGVAAVLASGASAAQLGTAFLRCPEAGTSEVHRQQLNTELPTVLTRAFTGRLARGIRNRFTDEHTGQAPGGYPDIHYLTAPLRAAGRAAEDPDVVNLWAGQTHQLAAALPAADLVRTLTDDARAALRSAADRLDAPQI